MPTEPIPALPKNFLRPCLLLLLGKSAPTDMTCSSGFNRSASTGQIQAVYIGRFAHWRRTASSAPYGSRPKMGPTGVPMRLTRQGMEQLHEAAKEIAAGHETVAGFLSRYQEFVALPAANGQSRRTGSPVR